jgi:hypothetical protein
MPADKFRGFENRSVSTEANDQFDAVNGDVAVQNRHIRPGVSGNLIELRVENYRYRSARNEFTARKRRSGD